MLNTTTEGFVAFVLWTIAFLSLFYGIQQYLILRQKVTGDYQKGRGRRKKKRNKKDSAVLPPSPKQLSPTQAADHQHQERQRQQHARRVKDTIRGKEKKNEPFSMSQKDSVKLLAEGNSRDGSGEKGSAPFVVLALRDKSKTGSEPVKPRFCVGAHVLARYRSQADWYPGVVTKVRYDGFYSILYDDGERETGVSPLLVKDRGDGTFSSETSDSDEAGEAMDLCVRSSDEGGEEDWHMVAQQTSKSTEERIANRADKAQNLKNRQKRAKKKEKAIAVREYQRRKAVQ